MSLTNLKKEGAFYLPPKGGGLYAQQFMNEALNRSIHKAAAFLQVAKANRETLNAKIELTHKPPMVRDKNLHKIRDASVGLSKALQDFRNSVRGY